VFRGGWDLDAAEAVCRPAELGLDLLDGTASLMDKSLVVRAPGEGPRFALLQTIGEFAYERLVARNQAQDAQRRHAVYFRDLAEAVEPTLAGAGAAAGTARLAAEQENLRAALAWAIAVGDAEIGLRLASAIWRYWQQRGQLLEGRVWFDSLLALPRAADLSPVLRAKALTAAGGVAYWRGDGAMQGYYAAALDIYRSLGDERGIADSLQNQGFMQMTARRGEPGAMEEGARLFEESLAMYQKLDDQPNIASVTGALGYSRMMAGHPEEARTAVTEAMTLNIAQGLIARANDNLFALGHISLLTGDLTAAAKQYRKALVDSHEMGDASRVLVRLSPVASILAATGHHEQALRLAGAVGRLRDEQGGIIAILPPGLTDPVVAAQSAGLTETQIEERLAEGRPMDLEGAVEYALEALPL
jgi:non-specific serine/threonine protein kinase